MVEPEWFKSLSFTDQNPSKSCSCNDVNSFRLSIGGSDMTALAVPFRAKSASLTVFIKVSCVEVGVRVERRSCGYD